MTRGCYGLDELAQLLGPDDLFAWARPVLNIARCLKKL